MSFIFPQPSAESATEWNILENTFYLSTFKGVFKVTSLTTS